MVKQICFVRVEMAESKFVYIYWEGCVVAYRYFEPDYGAQKIQRFGDPCKPDSDLLMSSKKHGCGRIGRHVRARKRCEFAVNKR